MARPRNRTRCRGPNPPRNRPPCRPLARRDAVRYRVAVTAVPANHCSYVSPFAPRTGARPAKCAGKVPTLVRRLAPERQVVLTLAQAGSAEAARIRATRPAWEDTEVIAPALACFAQARR